MSEGKPAASRARIVAIGILLSRLVGLVREKAFAWFFGVSPHADVLSYAFRAPNVLQNLLGEQTLSATFIPVYSRLLAEGRREEAGRFAGAIFGLLMVVVSVFVLLGVLLTPILVAVLAPGLLDDAAKVAAGKLEVDRLPLTIATVKVMFPMTGFLVLSAWALGILNSHRRFFLSYTAPIIWSSAILTALFWVVGRTGSPVVASVDARSGWLMAVCWGALVGGLLQFLIQLPLVVRLMRGFRPSLSLRLPGVKEALSTLGPALAGRGVVQLSLYVDRILASLLQAGAPTAVHLAGLLGNLPLSVFGMSVAAAELPELSRASGDEARQEMADRITRSLRQIAFVICPAVVGYLLFGYLVVGLVFQGGRFNVESSWLVYAALVGYTLGLLASSFSRLLQNAFFALRDTRTPARVATVRLISSAVFGFGLMFFFDRYSVSEVFGVAPGKDDLHLGAVGLSLSAGIASWWELLQLRLALRRQLPELRLPLGQIGSRFTLALGAASPAVLLWWWLPSWSTPIQAVLVLPLFALTYLGLAWRWRLPELDLWLGRWRR